MIWKLVALSGILAASGSCGWAILRERRLRSVRREQLRAFAELGHELKTPLNGIIGFSELLADGGLTLPEQQEAVADIRFAGHTLLGMIDNMLDDARLNAGQLQLRPRATNLSVFRSELPALLDALLRAKSLRLEIELPGTVPLLQLDPVCIRRILVNLIGNAIKFSDEGVIRVQFFWQPTGANRGTLILEVRDQGHGISAEEQKRIFEPFVQQKRHAAAGLGSGLGLSITRRMVELMHGSIALTSAPGEGSCFSVTLPEIESSPRD